MLSHWPIRRKLSAGIALLLITVTILAISGFRGVYAFRGLARSISRRATELPSAVALAQNVGALRATLRQRRSFVEGSGELPIDDPVSRWEFRRDLDNVTTTLGEYREQLLSNQADGDHIGDIQEELTTIGEIETSLESIRLSVDAEGWLQDENLVEQVDHLQMLAARLPSYLQNRMHAFTGEVRGHYRTWIVLTWVCSLLAGLLLVLLLQLFYCWVFRPLRTLIEGSRRVAAGNFDHRIRLSSQDEMAELAKAMNDMTRRFREVRDDLDQQVKQRTKEVVRSEQLASVGYLAAGVAHEINNPLASIALCAESLEERLRDLIEPYDDTPEGPDDDSATEDHTVVRDYLRMIQDEAFRCKEITERLLDFSRLGDVEKQSTDLTELVQGVIDMVGHVGRFKQKQIHFHGKESVVLPVNQQEIKQVVLNLITNGLDSLDPGGTVDVFLRKQGEHAELVVLDNGCGMTDDVKDHLFEPFFTRRRDGQGTGLGMSITFRIIADHGGEIEVASDGPGCGSQITVRLPLEPTELKEHEYQYHAA